MHCGLEKGQHLSSPFDEIFDTAFECTMSVDRIRVVARTHEIKVHAVNASAVAHMDFTNLRFVLKFLTLRIQSVSPDSSKELKPLASTPCRVITLSSPDFRYPGTVGVTLRKIDLSRLNLYRIMRCRTITVKTL
jgi:hypothetical protein